MELRPEVGEVVAQLGEAAASWDGIMPPCSQGENVVSHPKEMSDSMKYSEFDFLKFSLGIANLATAQVGSFDRFRVRLIFKGEGYPRRGYFTCCSDSCWSLGLEGCDRGVLRGCRYSSCTL